MILKRSIHAAALVTLFLLFSAAASALSLESQGSAPIIQDQSVDDAQSLALKDAFEKGLLEAARQFVPQSSSYALMKLFPEFIATRGTQDISQYKIISKTEDAGSLNVIVDLTLNEEPLRSWLNANDLSVPINTKPKIFLAVSSKGPSPNESFQWWGLGGKRRYSSFETQLAQSLNQLGQNVFMTAPVSNVIDPGETLAETAKKMQASYLVTGSISYALTAAKKLYFSSVKITIVNLENNETAGSLALSKTGSMEDVNLLMAQEVCTSIRKNIKSSPSLKAGGKLKTICIEAISGYEKYTTVFKALKSIDVISTLNIIEISDHTICHSATVKGSLDEAMRKLKKKLPDVDISVTDDRASIKIISE